MLKSLKIRIYPNKQQEELLNKTFGCVRFIYNHYLDQKIGHYKETGTNLSYASCSKDLTALKKELIWLKEVDKFALQNALRGLEAAYKNFFEKRSSFPTFKSKKRSKPSYKTSFTNNNIEIRDNAIKLPKLGFVHYRDATVIKEKIISVTLSKTRTGKYFASITYEKEDVLRLEKTHSHIGIDVGINDFLITSSGEKIKNPHFYRCLEKKLAKEQRILSRRYEQAKKENRPLSECKNYQKQKRRVAAIHEKIANQRKDFLQKLSTDIIKSHDVICVENINVKGLLQKHKLAKSISDVSWSEFIRQLEYKADWYGKQVIKIDRFYPSSKTCHICGHKEDLTLSTREWQCPSCHTIHDRDINAAVNILHEGLKQLA
ncbi:IS200/IS605 family element RNA-guided endonuclease TnpB [Peptococcus simiae]|uniref:IS200/IS605 family element RNA-guided endonuclease TnpB n=1 Tax=Peptococcus simiae TaxID=1643805 RepID=A0ABW9GZV5_9FIRM